MGAKPLFIADGHHRYETACNYRDELAAAGELAAADHPANFVLMMCVGMSDPGMLVLPTHRLFRGLPAMNSDATRRQARRRLRHARSRRRRRSGHARSGKRSKPKATKARSASTPAEDERWTLATLTDAGRQADGRNRHRAFAPTGKAWA